MTFKKFGISVKFVTDNDPKSFATAIDDKTKAIYIESITNPKYNVLDIPALAQVAHDHGIPLVVDNTFGINVQLCVPSVVAGGKGQTLQIATHGFGFDKRYILRSSLEYL